MKSNSSVPSPAPSAEVRPSRNLSVRVRRRPNRCGVRSQAELRKLFDKFFGKGRMVR